MADEAHYPTLLQLPEELRGPRVVVRPYRPADAEQLYDAIEESREHIGRWLPWVRAYRSVDDARDFCVRQAANWLLRSDLSAGIFEAQGPFLGGIRLSPRSWAARTFSVGYWLRQSVEGQGYVSEATRLLLHLAFETLAPRRVELTCDPRNLRSRRVAERLGFVLEGQLRNYTLDPAGQPRDSLMFSLLPEEYARLSAGW